VISSEQLRDLGLDKFWVRRRVVTGLLHPLHRGVYGVGRPDLSLRGRYLAAVLACGPGAVLSHRSAAHLWGLRSNAAGRVEVTIGWNQTGPAGVHTYRTRMLAPRDFTVIDGIPVTSVARTLLDLAAILRPPDLEVVIDRAERQALFDLNAVVDVLNRVNGRRGTKTLKRVIAAYENSTQESKLERAFKQLLMAAPDIASPSFNALVDGETGTHEVDALWQDARLAIQLDGFEFHRTRRDREKDASSDADLELAGYRVMRLTWDDSTIHGERTLRRIRLALGVA
jgi:very-short-patch-repair endonuclease